MMNMRPGYLSNIMCVEQTAEMASTIIGRDKPGSRVQCHVIHALRTHTELVLVQTVDVQTVDTHFHGR